MKKIFPKFGFYHFFCDGGFVYSTKYGGGKKCFRYEISDRCDGKVTGETEVKKEKSDEIFNNKTRIIHFEQILL